MYFRFGVYFTLTSQSITCADDGVCLHVVQESVDAAVVSGIQRVAVDPEMEVQPAGLGVKDHGIIRYSDVGSCCRLDVVLLHSVQRVALEIVWAFTQMLSLIISSLDSESTFFFFSPHKNLE